MVPPHLWDQIIEKFGGSHSSVKAFAHKLSKKLQWDNEFSMKAISEYKKFIYLGLVGDFVVTPSKIIDQVWHEHILFSKAYRQFCTEIIHFNFDHNPELLPMTDQTGRFNAQYLDTLELYKTEFGVDPPSRFWSIPKFDLVPANADEYESKKKNSRDSTMDVSPLHSYFGSSGGTDNENSLPEFEGFEDGSGGGSGANGSWNESDAGDQGGNEGSSDGGSDGGSSGCSSGCGGGGD